MQMNSLRGRLRGWRRGHPLRSRWSSPRRNCDGGRPGTRRRRHSCQRSRWRGRRGYRCFRRNHDDRWRTQCGDRSRRNKSRCGRLRRRLRWSGWLGGRRRCFLRCLRGGSGARWLCHRRLGHRPRRRMLNHFLLLRDGAQYVARTGNMREIDLGFNLVFGAGSRGARRPRLRGSTLGTGAKMLADEFGFVVFQRTRVRLFLGHAHRGQHVKNLFALDFQLTGQIIDSNLHPLSFSFSGPAIQLRDCLRSHMQPHGIPSILVCECLVRECELRAFGLEHDPDPPFSQKISSACLPELLLFVAAPNLRPGVLRLLRMQSFRRAQLLFQRPAFPLRLCSRPLLLQPH